MKSELAEKGESIIQEKKDPRILRLLSDLVGRVRLGQASHGGIRDFCKFVV